MDQEEEDDEGEAAFERCHNVLDPIFEAKLKDIQEGKKVVTNVDAQKAGGSAR